MVSCAVRSCSSRNAVDNKKTTKITFHRFPKDSARCEVWEKFVNRGNWKSTKYSVLCSKHFSDTCFDRTSRCHIRLRQDATPSLHQGETIIPRVQILSKNVLRPPYQVNDPEASTSYLLPSMEEPRPMTPMTVSTPLTSPTDVSSLELTPKKRKLLEKLYHTEEVSANRKRKLILLRRQLARKDKRISTMKNIISELKKRKL